MKKSQNFEYIFEFCAKTISTSQTFLMLEKLIKFITGLFQNFGDASK